MLVQKILYQINLWTTFYEIWNDMHIHRSLMVFFLNTKRNKFDEQFLKENHPRTFSSNKSFKKCRNINIGRL